MLKVAGGGGGGTAGLTYKGTWNASANSPTLTSGVGTNGDYYVVSTPGSTNLDGITDWQIGDWAIFNGTAWQKIDQSNTVTSVNGETGAVVLGVANIAGAVPNTVNVIAGTALSGGGALTGNVTINLANTAVIAGTYAPANITVDAQGRITAASIAAVTNGTVTSITAGTGLDGGTITSNGTISLANTAVTAGNYGSSSAVSSIAVDAQGRLTAASNVTIVATQVNLSNTSANATFVTSELPLVPEGYIVVQVAGVNKKIPYYGV
jgi:hypothetical protein